jgi:hypothetical protein
MKKNNETTKTTPRVADKPMVVTRVTTQIESTSETRSEPSITNESYKINKW